jgi:hypothetical protein
MGRSISMGRARTFTGTTSGRAKDEAIATTGRVFGTHEFPDFHHDHVSCLRHRSVHREELKSSPVGRVKGFEGLQKVAEGKEGI